MKDGEDGADEGTLERLCSFGESGGDLDFLAVSIIRLLVIAAAIIFVVESIAALSVESLIAFALAAIGLLVDSPSSVKAMYVIFVWWFRMKPSNKFNM